MIYYASETYRSMCAVLKMVRDKEVIPEGIGVTSLSVFHFLVYASGLILL